MSCNVRRCGLWAAIHGLVRTSPALLAAGSTIEGTAMDSPVSGGVTAGAAAGGGTVAAAPAGVSVAVFGDDIAGAEGAVGEVPLAPLTSCDCSGGGRRRKAALAGT